MSTQSLSPNDGDTSNDEHTGLMTRRTRKIYEQLTSNNIDKMVKRRAVSKAVTLVESTDDRRRTQATLLLQQIAQNVLTTSTSTSTSTSISTSNSSFRVGIAGPPGAGKSSFIETLGLHILGSDIEGNPTRLADESRETKKSTTPPWYPSSLSVLSIDPSSTYSGGSILGDKTRMPELSRHPSCFVRPSPSSTNLGGINAYTSDVIQLMTAASYECCIVETVGVGQSEVEVDKAVDMMVLIVPPGGGDDLQGSKKGIVEVADMLIVNKADGPLLSTAQHTCADYRGAIRWQGRGKEEIRGDWKVPVLLVSAHEKSGVAEMWRRVGEFREKMMRSGGLATKRVEQGRYWTNKFLKDMIARKLAADETVKERREKLDRALAEGAITPRMAATQLIGDFDLEIEKKKII
ncbi:hypothetical protein TrVE_jg10114 [Triparma verrucosa]|uniref:Uncharacterized protein n=1 Tax=Triparma verrucosa TaxID=1606542 RepID=A0A9W7CHL6_9STRA|nr:hypothetical protein TrVE_jg10114 [Triparma verrucosa]